MMATTKDPDVRICYCMKVDRRRILAAIRDGASTVEEIMARTRAGTGCGTCRLDLLALLREHGALREAR